MSNNTLNSVFARYDILGESIYIDKRNGNFSSSYEELVEFPFSEVEPAPKYSNDLYRCVTFCLEISDACNLKCSYCFNENKTGKKMSFEEAEGCLNYLFKFFNKAERYFIDVSGCGEPLLNLKLINQIADYAKRKSNEIDREIVVSFVTNGTLLSEEVVRFLQKMGILFGVSLDGNKLVHDSHRQFVNGAGTYSSITRNVSAIDHREYLGCAVTITKEVFPLLPALQELNRYFSTISVKPVRSEEWGIDEESCLAWLKEYEELEHYLEQRVSLGDTSLLFCLLNGADYFGKFILRSFLGIKALSRCDGATGRVGVSINGSFYPCIAMIGSNEKLGDMESGFDFRSAKQFYDGQIVRDDCKCCDFRFLCGGECAVERNEHNGLNNMMCSFKKELILLSMVFEEHCRYFGDDIYDRIINFCVEKRKRTMENPLLRKYRDSHKDLTFVEARERFYDAKE